MNDVLITYDVDACRVNMAGDEEEVPYWRDYEVSYFHHYTLVLPVLFLLGGRLFFKSVFTNHLSLVVLFSRLPWIVLLHKPW